MVHSAKNFSFLERWQATLQGVQEAKDYVQSLEKTNAAKTASTSSLSAATVLKKFFRKASPKSIAMGKARLHMEEAVKRSERILMEKKRLETAKTASREEEAEVIAQELYHTPGTLLDKKEMAHIYQTSGCEELRPEPDCSTVAFYHSVRTISGICNNLEEPTQGASFTPFRRLIQAQYENGIDTLFNSADLPKSGPFTAPHPSARFVSDTAVLDREVNDTVLTHLVMQWGQFMDHDLDLTVELNLMCNLTTCEQTGFCAPVRVPRDDQEFGEGTANNGMCLPFVRTVPACSENPFQLGPREQVNELTHYIDGSNVYGSTDARAAFLREFEGGRLRVGPGNTLPLQGSPDNLGTDMFCPPVESPNGEIDDPESCCMPQFENGCFVAGDVRALEHVSLSVIHTIWVREHNRIANGLSGVNPQWDDERLYTETRRILIAEIQHITFNEYLPALFGTNFPFIIPPYREYNPEVDASVPNAFATAAYRFGHSQIQPFFERLDSSFRSIPEGPLFLRDSFFSSTEFENGGGVPPIVRGWVHQPARAVDEFVNSVLTSRLFEPDNSPGGGMDLVALNIQRGRDHGLPQYGTWRRFCGVTSVFRNELTRIRLLQMYGSIDQADLFVAALAEEPLEGGVLGPTLSCIFAFTFIKLRDGDRFWYENRSPDLSIFTDEQFNEISTVTMSNILCDNAGIDDVQENAFKLSNNQDNALNLCVFKDNGVQNFNLWREESMCFYRISTSTLEPTSWLLFQRPSNTGVRFLMQSNPVTQRGTTIQCIAFNCPNSTFDTIITTSVELQRRANCEILPQGSGQRVRSVTVSTGTLNVPGDGIFASQTECENSEELLLSYSCDGQLPSRAAKASKTAAKKMASAAELENELAKLLGEDHDDIATAQNGGTTIVTLTEPVDLSNPNIDPEALDALNGTTVRTGVSTMQDSMVAS